MVNPVAMSALQLQPVAGTAQAITLDHAFQPLTVRVTDSSSPPNPILGASVAFQNTLMRPGSGANSVNSGMPVILSETQSTVTSDVNGLAGMTPSAQPFNGTLDVEVSASVGNALLNYVLQAFPPPVSVAGGSGRTRPVSNLPTPVRGIRQPAD